MFSYVVAGGLAALGTALALAWKWQLGLRRTAAAVTALATASATLVTMLGKALALSGRVRAVLTGASTLAGAFAVLAYRFYRDPERVAPDRDDAIVSPADGTVLYVHHSSNGELPVATKHGRNYTLRELTGTPLQIQSAIVIGIGMSFLDVHVNRAPSRAESRCSDASPDRSACCGTRT